MKEVLWEIAAAEKQAGREGQVRLVAVSKGRSLQEMEILDPAWPLGENRGQELRDKAAVWPEREWHFIGPIQRNKIKYLQPVTLIHTIEALWQAEAIADAAAQWGHAPDLLIQVHNGEPQKHGVMPSELATLVRDISETGLQVQGLMVMAPYQQPTLGRALFQETANRAHDLGLKELSMGMSDDFVDAIAAGATLVRVGRRLFPMEDSL